MGFRFHKRIRILPGVHLNLSKSGVSLSIGPQGAKVTIGSRGVTGTVGIPGTGISYSKRLGVPTENLAQQFTMPDHEEAFVKGVRAYAAGDLETALPLLQEAAHTADGAFLVGILLLQKERLDEAAHYLNIALTQKAELSQTFAQYELQASALLEITDEITAEITPSELGVMLALAEVAQAQGNSAEAVRWLETLYQAAPEDRVVRLSLAELLIDSADFQRVMQLAEGVQNDTPLDTTLLLYRSKALLGLGMADTAKTVLTEALRRKKDRSLELMQALRYERALCYEALGDVKAARKDFEAIYAEMPTYEDVAQRLGIQ